MEGWVGWVVVDPGFAFFLINNCLTLQALIFGPLDLKNGRGSNLSTTGDFPQMEDSASTILKIYPLARTKMDPPTLAILLF